MKIAIITGATSGIGYEAAIQIDERFQSLDEIWIIGRREEKLLELAARLKHSVRTIAMDVTSEEERKEFRKFLMKASPSIRMLFQSAGAGLHGRFSEQRIADSTDMLRLNCEALTWMAGTCLPFMKAGSHMINVASSAAFAPFPGYAVYAASKSYVLSFSRALREELRNRKVYVMAVCPGPVNTPFFDISERYSKGVSPFKRQFMNTPSRVVKKALDDAGFHKSVSTDTMAITAFRYLGKTVSHDILTPVISAVANRLG